MQRKIKQQTKYSSPLFYPSLFLLLIVLPVFFLQQTMDKVLMPRLLLLNSFLLIFYLIVLLKSATLKFDYSVLKNKIFLFFLLFCLLTFISQFWALNFKEGFFDTVKTFSTLLLCFALVQLILHTENAHLKITRFIIVAAIISSFIGIYEYVHKVLPDPTLEIDKNPVIYQVRGIFGHKNQFAIALALQLPFLVFGFLKLKSLWRAGAAFALFMSLLMIVLLETRSVWVALVFVVPIVTTIGLFHFRIPGFKIAQPKKLILPLLIAGVILVAGIVAASRYEPISKKIASITNPSDARNIHRVKAWNFTLKMAIEKPLTGVGAGNWKLEAPRFHKDAGFRIDDANWVRPHNDFLWVLAEKGIFGFFFFIFIFILGYIQALKIIRSKTASEKKLFVLLVFGGLMIYTIISFFTFPLERMNHQIYLALFLAIIISGRQFLIADSEFRLSRKLVIIPAIFLAALGSLYAYEIVRVETLLRKANHAMENSHWNESIEYAKKALSPFRDFDAENVPIKWYLGSAYNSLGNYGDAIKYMKEAYQISPNNALVMNNLGQIYFNAGESKKAIKVLKKALSYYPRFMEANVNISSCYYSLNDYYRAYKALLFIPMSKRTEVVKNNMNILAVKLGKKKSGRAKREMRAELNLEKPKEKIKK